MLLIDAFPANNEISLINFRVNYLFNQVDLFIIAESAHTHSGEKKPLYISQWLKERPDLSEKVKTLVIDLKSKEEFSSNWGKWDNEQQQRTQLAKFIHEHFENAQYILSDADELPSRAQVEKLRFIQSPHRFITSCSYLHANFLGKGMHHKSWCHGLMSSTTFSVSHNGGRYIKYPILECAENGLHVSYQINDLQSLRNKLESNASQRFNQDYMKSPLFLNFCSKMAISPLGEFHTKGFGLLKVQVVSDFSEQQRLLWLMYPSLFGATAIDHSIFRRVFSSLLVSAVQRQYWHREELLQAFIHKTIPKRPTIYAIVYVQIFYSLLQSIRNTATRRRQ